MNTKYLFVIFLVINLVLLVGCEQKSLSPLTSGNIEIIGTNWNIECLIWEKSHCANIKSFPDTYVQSSPCGGLKINLIIPSDVKNERNNPGADCKIYDNGILISSSYGTSLGEGNHNVGFGNLNVLKDHNLKICCVGDWEISDSLTACQSAVLERFCD